MNYCQIKMSAKYTEMKNVTNFVKLMTHQDAVPDLICLWTSCFIHPAQVLWSHANSTRLIRFRWDSLAIGTYLEWDDDRFNNSVSINTRKDWTPLVILDKNTLAPFVCVCVCSHPVEVISFSIPSVVALITSARPLLDNPTWLWNRIARCCLVC